MKRITAEKSARDLAGIHIKKHTFCPELNE